MLAPRPPVSLSVAPVFSPGGASSREVEERGGGGGCQRTAREEAVFGQDSDGVDQEDGHWEKCCGVSPHATKRMPAAAAVVEVVVVVLMLAP